MKRSRHSSFMGLMAAIVVVLLVGACETWRSECAGEIVVENPIPDTTIHLNDTLFIDLFEPPPVLRQTEGQSISINVISSDRQVVTGTNVKSPTTGEINAVKVIPRTTGTTNVIIFASDICMEIELSFQVTVVDTTQ